MKRRYVVGLGAAAIGLLVVVLALVLWRRGEPIVGQATPVPTHPRPEYTPQPEGAVAPVIVERSPARGEELASDGSVRLVFDRSMDRGSVEAAFVVSPAVAGRLEWDDDRTVRFLPASPLDRAKAYDVVLDQRAKASDGAALNSAYQFRFATAGYLEVAQALPADGSNEVEADAVITVVFNRPVVALKVAEEQDTLPQPLSFEPPIAGAGEWLNTSVYVFRPAKPLAGGTTYAASIAELKDVDGNPLSGPYKWSWTTVRPKVLYSDPGPETGVISVEPDMTIQFNQPIDQASAEQSIQLLSDGAAVPLKIEVLSETVSIAPAERLAFDTKYELVAAAGLRGHAGGAGMAQDYRIAFKTVPLPRILRTQPIDGEKSVEPSRDFVIVFNAPINPDSVMANLSMTPAFTPTEVYSYFDSYSYEFHLYFNPRPSTDYAVSIGPNIADPYGNVTGQAMEIAFRTNKLTPSAQLIVPGGVGSYNANNPTKVGVRSVNKETVEFELYRMPAAELRNLDYAWNDTLPPGAESIRTWTESLKAPLNESVVTRVDLVAGGGSLAPGAYMLVLDDGDQYPERHILVVSGLNLTLKSAERGALLWANDLAGGKPAAGLKVAFYDRHGAKLGEAATDDQGVASIAIDRTTSEGVIALIEKPFGAIADDWAGGVSAWDFGLQGTWDLPEMTAYIYTDRPIYRPDQRVEFKGVLRNEDDARFSLAGGIGKIETTITDAAGEQVFKDSLALSDLGTFAGSLTLGPAAALGQYAIQIAVGDRVFNGSFQVAAYRAPEFEVTVKPAAAESVRGSASKATAAATYFFGGPVANVPVSWNVLAEDYSFQPEWAGRYQFSATDDPWRCWECWWRPMPAPVTILSGAGATDAKGELAIELPAELKDSAGLPITRSVRLTIEATATGKDNQVISGRDSVVVHAGDLYVGLAPQNYVGKANQEQKIDLVVADTAEKRVAAQAVEVEILRYTWDNRYVKREDGGGSWEWSEERTSVARQSVRSDANGETVVAWTPSEAGSYQVVAKTRDRGGREVSSAIFVWVAGEGYVSWRRDNNDRINLISDRTSYKPGETADILIPSPFQGPHWALISVERGGVLSHEVRRMEGNSAVYSLPLKAEHAPNIYVTVVLFTAADGATGAPGYKVGILPLAVAPDPQSLRVSLKPSVAQAEPGQSVEYAIETTDLNGQPVAAELSLDLVDKAVLSLSPRTPDAIREAFYGRRGLGVATANDLTISADRLQEELERDEERQRIGTPPSGGAADLFRGDTGAALGAPLLAAEDAAKADGSLAFASAANAQAAPPTLEVRGEFADTAYWNATLATDAAGRASVTVKLPDNLTTWVMRGVGLTGDTKVGEGLNELVVTKPLLIRPVTPRFFVVGDTVELAANVSNNTDSPIKAEVALNATGLSVGTPLTLTVEVPAHGEANATWRATAQDAPAASLVFSAVAGRYNDASKPRLGNGPDGSVPIYRYSAPENVGTGGQLEAAGSRTEVVALPSNVDTSRGELTVRIDPSLAAGMRDSLAFLEHYEYECTEQTVSRFLPNVLTARALSKLGVPNAELEARLPDLVEQGRTRLYNQQHADGGWGWWYDDESNPHISAYVVFALLRAREAGYEVKEDALSRGLDYLATVASQHDRLNSADEADLQAWLLYVLSAGGRSDGEREAALYAQREKMSTYARALLAMSLRTSGAAASDERIQTLLSDINNAAIISANGAHWEEDHYDWWSMNTDTRSTAVILAALVQLDPENQLNPNVVRWLMVARKDGIWETTQESAWSIIALTDWMVHTGELKADYDYAAWLNDQEQSAGHVSPADVEKPIILKTDVAKLLRDQGNRLTLSRGAGPGRLYYTAYLRAYLPVEDIKALNRGVIVSRRYTMASCLDGPKCPEVTEVKLGDVVRVEVSVTAPHDLYYLALEDPLPAGTEAVDTGLATTSLLAQAPSLNSQPGEDEGELMRWYWGWWHWYSRSELRDEKVALFADYLAKGSYEYTYTMRATTVGQFHVIPTTASELYFPEVYGRGDGSIFTVTR